MADFDPEEFLNQTGIDTRFAQPVVEPPLSSAGERAQAELLHRLSVIHAAIGLLEVAVRDRPNDDATFETLNASFGGSLEEARAAFQRFRDLRDCRGAG